MPSSQFDSGFIYLFISTKLCYSSLCITLFHACLLWCFVQGVLCIAYTASSICLVHYCKLGVSEVWVNFLWHFQLGNIFVPDILFGPNSVFVFGRIILLKVDRAAGYLLCTVNLYAMWYYVSVIVYTKWHRINRTIYFCRPSSVFLQQNT